CWRCPRAKSPSTPTEYNAHDCRSAGALPLPLVNWRSSDDLKQILAFAVDYATEMAHRIGEHRNRYTAAGHCSVLEQWVRSPDEARFFSVVRQERAYRFAALKLSASPAGAAGRGWTSREDGRRLRECARRVGPGPWP